jgi:hypothetical protein
MQRVQLGAAAAAALHALLCCVAEWVLLLLLNGFALHMCLQFWLESGSDRLG